MIWNPLTLAILVLLVYPVVILATLLLGETNMKIEVSKSFYLAAVIGCFFTWNHLPTVLSLVLPITAFVFLHEIGHAAVGAFWGFEVEKLVFGPMGGCVKYKRTEIMPRPLQWASMVLAGPAMNLLIAGLLFMCFGFDKTQATLSGFTKLGLDSPHVFTTWIIINVLSAVWNLLPFLAHDGNKLVLCSLIFCGVKRPMLFSHLASLGSGIVLYALAEIYKDSQLGLSGGVAGWMFGYSLMMFFAFMFSGGSKIGENGYDFEDAENKEEEEPASGEGQIAQ
jgi:Zn-dependent protease